jgi:hypothetical protein
MSLDESLLSVGSQGSDSGFVKGIGGIALAARDGTGLHDALGVDPREQFLNHSWFSGVLQRLPLRRDVLCKFGEHLGAQLDRVLFVERDASHPRYGIAAQRR